MFVHDNLTGVPADPGCVLNFLHDVNARQEQIRSDGTSPVIQYFDHLTI